MVSINSGDDSGCWLRAVILLSDCTLYIYKNKCDMWHGHVTMWRVTSTLKRMITKSTLYVVEGSRGTVCRRTSHLQHPRCWLKAYFLPNYAVWRICVLFCLDAALSRGDFHPSLSWHSHLFHLMYCLRGICVSSSLHLFWTYSLWLGFCMFAMTMEALMEFPDFVFISRGWIQLDEN